MNSLKRQLGVPGAVMIGLASMVGAGVFYVWAPAAAAAGSLLLVALLIAAVIATLNALSTAQLAMAHPVSGGAYAFGRRLLGPWWGFTAGWLFLAGKTASAAAIALIAGSYLWPEHARLVAVLAIAVLAIVNAFGVRSTARFSTVVVVLVLTALSAVIIASAVWFARQHGSVDLAGLTGASLSGVPDASPLGVLQAAGLLFFCFAGYARMATLGEEVRDPRRTLPRAILGALAVALIVYAALGTVSLLVLGPARLAASTAPLADLTAVVAGFAGGSMQSSVGVWAGILSVVAVIACLGSLIGILAGLSRTSLAMARDHELPGVLSKVSPKHSSPLVAEMVMALIAIAAVIVLDPAWLVGFSASCVLVYYAIAHCAALRQPAAERWLHPAVHVIGAAGCLLLAFTLPWQGVLLAAAVLCIGLAARGIRSAQAQRASTTRWLRR